MKTLRKYALFTTIAIYILIYMGGLVRVSGAGLGCPDWPKCFDSWIPPISAGQLPPHIDPLQFNFVLAWTEYINRLVGVCAGILVLITTVLAFRYARHVPKILYTIIGAAILIAFQGWQGGELVEQELEPFLVSIHMGLALVILSMFIYVTQQVYYMENPHAESASVYPSNTAKWIAGLWGLSIIQIVLGTQIRETNEILTSQFPLASVNHLLQKAGSILNVHWMSSIVMFVVTWFIGIRILKSGSHSSLGVRHCVWIILVLIFVQIIIGSTLIVADMPELMQLFHLWIASFYIGGLLIIFNAIRKAQGGVHVT